MIEPYWSGDGITIYAGNSLQVGIAEVWVGGDVLITDPPYGMSYISNSAIKGWDGHVKTGPTEAIEGDGNPGLRDDMMALWGDEKPALVFGTWRVPRPTRANIRQLLIWDKGDSPGMGDVTFPWGPGHEEMYVYGQGWVGSRRTNVIRVPTIGARDKDRPNHPTPKPVPLLERLVENAPPGVIVDPFMGSGSTLKAARLMGREAIGVEVNEEYCEEAVKVLAQGVLF